MSLSQTSTSRLFSAGIISLLCAGADIISQSRHMTENQMNNSNETVTIGSLVTAPEKTVVTIDDTVKFARTLMIMNDVDRLLVMSQKPTKSVPRLQSLEGIITWKSLGKYTSESNASIKDHMDPDPHPVKSGTSLWQVVPIILRREFVIVHENAEIKGTVSVTDYARFLTELTQPYSYLRQIEIGLRSLLQNADIDRVPIEDFPGRAAEKARRQGDDAIELYELTLDELVKAVCNNWENLGGTIDQAAFGKQSRKIVELRNSLLHFRPLHKEKCDDMLGQLKRMHKTVQVMLRQTGKA